MDSATFTALMSRFPTGVAVVTTTDGDGCPFGLTCSSLCAVSLDPPLLLVCIRSGSRTLAATLARGVFAVNLLHTGGREAAVLFSSRAANRFQRVPWRATPRCGLPSLTAHAHVVAECEVRDSKVAGDHTILIGEVTHVDILAGTPPLLYGLRQYACWPGRELADARRSLELR